MPDTLLGSDTSLRSDVTCIEVPWSDPHVNEHQRRVTDEISELTALAHRHYGGRTWRTRSRTGSVDALNPATAAFIQRLPVVGEWLSQIPTAAALQPCYLPEIQHLTTGRPIDPETREWFRNGLDPIGIRSRAEALKRILADRAIADPMPQRWLSLACGAAQPVLASLAEVRRAGGRIPTAVIADLDRGSLAIAQRQAEEADLVNSVHPLVINVLDPRGIGRDSRIAHPRSHGVGSWKGAFDVVEAVGLLEYLTPDDRDYTYSKVVSTRRRLAGAITFLRSAFACVRPGGRLVVANMLDSHPQLAFTLDVVQWPHIVPRSIGEIVRIIEEARIDGGIEVHLPADGVYALYVITKPF